MVKELRVDEGIGVIDATDITGIVLGDEGCIYKVVNKKIINAAKKGNEKGLNIRLLTPFVPNRLIDQAYKQIELLSSLCKLKVSFNDYGLIHRCEELIRNGRITPVCGRILTRSILDCPWYDELLYHEPNELKGAVIGPNYLHPSKWDLLKKYSISEIEINLTEETFLEELRESGITLTCHISSNIISVGRVCFTARWYGLKLPECSSSSECRKRIDISLDKKWGKMKLMCEEIGGSVKKYYEDMYLEGNIVYKVNNKGVNYSDTIPDSIII